MISLDSKLVKIIKPLPDLAKDGTMVDAGIILALGSLIEEFSNEITRLNKEIKSLQDKISLLDHSL